MKATKLIFKTFLSSAFKAGVLSSLMIAQVHFAYAQTASILPPAKTTFLDQNGKPLTGGTVKFYIPGTTTPKTTWQDSGETVPNTNPVVLDSAGRGIILGDGSYRQQVFDKKGNLIWDQQTASGGGSGGGGTATVGDGNLVGTIKPWAGFVAPSQYVFAYGQELPRTSFPLLFSTITTQQNVSCTSGNATLSGLSDTSQIPIGAPIESICLNAGATVVSTTISTIVASSNAIITTNSSARIFPFGNGDGSVTFNVPDFRGRTLAGRDNMGGTAANRLTSSATGFGVTAALGAVAGNQSTTLGTPNLPAYTPVGSVGVTITGITQNTRASATSGTSDTGSLAQGNTGGAGLSDGIPFISGAATANFTGSAQGGTSTPISRIQPTEIINYVIKTLPDTNANTFFGVASIGGMFGVINCGFGITCAGNSISAIASTVAPPTPTNLGGVFSATCSTHNWFSSVDTTGTFGCTQPAFSDISGVLSLASGGTNANLTASNGGVVWSNASQLQILAGTATARLPLLSGSSATPVWGAYTLPASAISGGIPYFSSTSAMTSSALLTANAIILGGGAGVSPSSLGSLGTTTTLLHGNAAGVPTFGQVVSADITTNTVANSNLAQVAATTLKGNPTNATANASDFTIQGLTARGAPDAANDKMLLYDNAAGTFKYVTPAQVASAATAGVSSLGGTTGAIGLTAADLAISGSNLQLSAGRKTLSSGCAINSTAAVTCADGSAGANNGTYTVPTGTLWLEIELVGGGGGGCGSGTSPGAAGVGAATTFGTGPLLTSSTTVACSTSAGGTGGTGSGGFVNKIGATGGNGSGLTNQWGGAGAVGPYGGGGVQGQPNLSAGGAALANSGSGGGGGGCGATVNSGGGGGAGGFVRAVIQSPNATYSYAIGAGGTGGTAGTSGAAGGAGGSGFIQIIPHFN